MGFHEERAAELNKHVSKLWEIQKIINNRTEVVSIGLLCHEMLHHDPEAHTIYLESSDNDDQARFEGWSRKDATTLLIDADHSDWDDEFNDNYMWHIASSLEWVSLEGWGFVSSGRNGSRYTFVIEEALTWLAQELGATFDVPSDLTPAGIEAWLADRKENP